MSDNDMNSVKQKETPYISGIGILVICIATVPLLYGISQMKINSIIIGLIIAFIGVICLMIGIFISKKKK